MPVTATAPGKAVLLGEYAVVDGQPALAMAVERRARVTAAACPRAASRVEVPQLGLGPVAFGWSDDGRLCWPGEDAQLPAFARCRELMTWVFERDGKNWSPDAGLQVCIDTAALFDRVGGEQIKLGLGSSAAVTLALTAALQGMLGVQDAIEPGIGRLKRLLETYRRAQGGQGSGIDLAASLYGGVIRYQLRNDGPEVASVRLPPDLKLMFIWSGEAASTAGFLAAHAHWRADQPVAAERLHAEMGRCVETALTCLGSSDTDGFMTCINSYRGLMGKIGDEIKQPVMSDVHLALGQLADRHDVAYKPSGAGGGDLGILAATDPDRLAGALAEVRAAGFRVLDLEVAATGLAVNIPNVGGHESARAETVKSL